MSMEAATLPGSPVMLCLVMPARPKGGFHVASRWLTPSSRADNFS